MCWYNHHMGWLAINKACWYNAQKGEVWQRSRSNYTVGWRDIIHEHMYRTGNILYRIAYRTMHIGITDANRKWMAAVATNSRIIKYPLSYKSPGLRGHQLEIYQA